VRGQKEIKCFNADKIVTVDTCGAGDTFHGAFAYGISLGWPVDKVVSFSAWAAAMKCTAFGKDGLPNRGVNGLE
jgi:sugar/nucleoside kinase (ribokinase family)